MDQTSFREFGSLIFSTFIKANVTKGLKMNLHSKKGSTNLQKIVHFLRNDIASVNIEY